MAVRWDNDFLPDLVRIFGDAETADEVIYEIDWRLSRNPQLDTWGVATDSDIRLGWIRSRLDRPAIYFSFTLITEGGIEIPLLLHARAANDPELS